MAEPPREATLRRIVERSTGFALRPVLLPDRAAADRFRDALAGVGPPVDSLVGEPGRWEAVVDQVLTRHPSQPLLVWGRSLGRDGRVALGRLNRGRDTLIARAPALLWWGGPSAFLAECGAAMPDMWSVRAPTLEFESAPALDFEPAAPTGGGVAPLLPAMEADVRAFAEWVTATFRHVPGLWLEGEAPLPLRPAEAVAGWLRPATGATSRLVAIGNGLLQLVDAAGPLAPVLLQHLERLGAFAGVVRGWVTERASRRRLWPGADARALWLRGPDGTALPWHDLVRQPGARTVTVAGAELADALFGLCTEGALVGEFALTMAALDVRAAWILERTGLPVVTHAWANRDVGRFPATRPITLIAPPGSWAADMPSWHVAPLSRDEARAYVAAWLPDDDADAVLALLGRNPHRAGLLTDLARLLPFLHELTPLPTHGPVAT